MLGAAALLFLLTLPDRSLGRLAKPADKSAGTTTDEPAGTTTDESAGKNVGNVG